MLRVRGMTTLIVATRNLHKVREIEAILGPTYRFHSSNEFPGLPEVAEDAATFAGNATKKAVAVADWLRAGMCLPGGPIPLPMDQKSPVYVLADDSGLEVDALRGQPGIHSARFAALEKRDSDVPRDEANNRKLLGLLAEVPLEKRTARFRCVIALVPMPPARERFSASPCSVDGTELQVELFEGVCEGKIRLEPAGAAGFGYDPLFVPEGFRQSFAEMEDRKKNTLSHRFKALMNLRDHFGRSQDMSTCF